jgi:hypothetical protein
VKICFPTGHAGPIRRRRTVLAELAEDLVSRYDSEVTVGLDDR